MAGSKWLIYGANGYTGALVVEEALKRGHRPVIAGRSEKKIKPVAERTGLDFVIADTNDAASLKNALTGVDLVFNAAGPFIHTSDPVIRACLECGVHYTDITGEVPVFHNTFSHDKEAMQKGIVLMSGIGFDVIPTDCLAKYVAERVSRASELEIAFAGLTETSPGTTKTMIEMIPNGGLVRKNGELVRSQLGKGAKKIEFTAGTYSVMPIPWGDLETAYHTTGIPNITTYISYPGYIISIFNAGAPLAQKLLSVKAVQQFAKKFVDMFIHGPDAEKRSKGRSYIWVQARDIKGKEAHAWLEIPDTYRFTAVASVTAIEKILELRPKGALTPAMAFGADFVLGIEGVKRYDKLPGRHDKQ